MKKKVNKILREIKTKKTFKKNIYIYILKINKKKIKKKHGC